MNHSFQKLFKVSAKFAFRKLRDGGPYYCKSLDKEIHVNREFWSHLVFVKERTRQESAERYLVISAIEEILNNGRSISQNKNFTRVEHEVERIPLSCVIQKKKEKYILLSAFVRYKKNDLPPA